MTTNKRVGVVMGGWGEEREISLETGAAVLGALLARGHDAVPIDAGPSLAQALQAERVDVAFLALHGRVGEDGGVQGLCEVLGLPYTGSGVLASALAMDKPMAKNLFRLHNLPSPRGYRVSAAEAERALEFQGDLGFPVVVKPARGGSSVGVSVVESPEDLVASVRRAAACGGEALVERRVCGREVTVAILGGRVLGSCEMEYAGEAWDYAHKYQGGTRYFVPARLSQAALGNTEALSLAAYRALGCRGYGRVDLICGGEDNEQLLEVNTLPGLTPMSLLPKIAARNGLAFERLVETILGEATLDTRSPPARGEQENLDASRRVAG